MKLHDYTRFASVVVEPLVTTTQPLIILIAGPYRSGTNDDPHLIAKNLDRLESFALSVYRAGHIPMIGEWIALPLIRKAGGVQLGDAISEQFLYPVASRLLERCHAVLRIEGESKGADQDVRIARERGLPVYFHLEEVPGFGNECFG
jgi:type III secretory pathway component EscU